MPREFVPPRPWEIFLFSFWLLPAQFLLELCTAVTSRGKENFLGSSAVLIRQQLLQLTAPSHLPPPSVHGWTSWAFPGCPGHLPAQTTGQQGKTGPTQETPSLTQSLSASAPSRLCLQPVLQRTPVPHALHFASLFLQPWQTKRREYKNTHYTRWLAYDIVSFQSKCQIDYLLALSFFS